MNDKKHSKRLNLYLNDSSSEISDEKKNIKKDTDIFDILNIKEKNNTNISSSMFVNESFQQSDDFDQNILLDFDTVMEKIDNEIKNEQNEKLNESDLYDDISCNLTDFNFTVVKRDDLNYSAINIEDLNDTILDFTGTNVCTKNSFDSNSDKNKSFEIENDSINEENGCRNFSNIENNISKVSVPVILEKNLNENKLQVFLKKEDYKNFDNENENTDAKSSDTKNINKIEKSFNNKILRKFSSIKKLEIYLKEFIITHKCIKRQGYDLTRSDLSILLFSKWLNDKIINSYLEMLSNDDLYVFSSYFYTNLKHNLQRVLKYTKNINIFKFKFLYFPVHLNSHWIFVCYDTIKNNLEYRDSFNQKDLCVIKNISKYLEHEYQRINKIVLTCNILDIDFVEEQSNSYDCGVFLLMYAKHRIYEQDKFKYKNMKIYRKIILHEIILNKIIYDINYSFKDL